MRGDDFNARGGYPVEVFARRFQVLWLALFTDIVLLNTMPARVELTAHNTISGDSLFWAFLLMGRKLSKLAHYLLFLSH